ncbi:hypothetical protein BGW80DRAFT_1261610, partial [Lactifluus volemus]
MKYPDPGVPVAGGASLSPYLKLTQRSKRHVSAPSSHAFSPKLKSLKVDEEDAQKKNHKRSESASRLGLIALELIAPPAHSSRSSVSTIPPGFGGVIVVSWVAVNFRFRFGIGRVCGYFKPFCWSSFFFFVMYVCSFKSRLITKAQFDLGPILA